MTIYNKILGVSNDPGQFTVERSPSDQMQGECFNTKQHMPKEHGRIGQIPDDLPTDEITKKYYDTLTDRKYLLFAINYCRFIGTNNVGLIKDILQKEGGINTKTHKGHIAVFVDQHGLYLDSDYFPVQDDLSLLDYIKEIFSGMAKLNITMEIIIAQNHPCGDPTPSETDSILINSIFSLGQQFKVVVRDYVIVGNHSMVIIQK